MNSRLLALLLAYLLLLTGTGCLRVATAPMRAAREEKAEAAFTKLAARSPEQLAGFMNDRMAQSLALTPDQKPAIEAINLNYARQMHATAASPDSVRTKAKALKQQDASKEAELKAVLTPDQFTHYQEMREEMRDNLKSMGGK